MTDGGYFQPGQTILLREIVQGRLWSAKPGIIVRDSPEMVALYAPPGTMVYQPRKLDGTRVKADNRVRDEWDLVHMPWSKYHILRLSIPGAAYSVLAFWDEPGMIFRDWYINLEDPLRRIPGGFEYLDQWLDAIVAADLLTWHWKDEDEFAEAVLLKLITPERARDLRREGERVAAWIQTGKSPFNVWETWRPDPAWKTPVLPEGWDKG